MPIATCFVRSDVGPIDADRVVEAWSDASGVADDEMTVNVLSGGQGGKRYAVTASLTLPSLWGDDEVERLACGLARALADVAGVSADSVVVTIAVIESGAVIEGGRPVRW